jgi:adenosylcobyric acid synthase
LALTRGRSAWHSSAGKTFLVTAFARYFANQGLRVAPFKGQNMSNNARVVTGGEIGVAQYIQALAARQVPDASAAGQSRDGARPA